MMRATMAHFPYDPSIITDELVEDRYQASLIPAPRKGCASCSPSRTPMADAVVGHAGEGGGGHRIPTWCSMAARIV